jgi:hypothetical protein
MFSLTRNEALLVCDTLGGRHLSRYVVGQRPLEYLVSDVEGPMKIFELDRRWEVDASSILDKLRALNFAQRRALIEAVDRFWDLAKLPPDEALRKAGLL